MRRGAPELVVGLLLAVLLSSYVVYTRRVVRDLRAEAQRSSLMYARVLRAQTDTSADAGTQALFDLTKSIIAQGVPIVVTDVRGRPTYHANLPLDSTQDEQTQLRRFVGELDRQNAPVTDSLVGKIHFGNPALVKWLRIIPALQAASAFVLLFAGIYIVRTRGNAERERVLAGMARESAHQLGTPLSSLAGWIELLEDRADDETSRTAATHMRADLDRLDRVAHRFERIGRDPKLENVDVVGVVERVARYFQARVPTLANSVAIECSVAPDLHRVRGDPVLLEWAVEVLAKNAIDALAGRGGRVSLVADHGAEPESVVIRVADDGPGIPSEIRSRVFEPGFSTKQSGWGIGLSLAKRIVEENHGGKLVLAPSEQGATFEIILQ